MDDRAVTHREGCVMLARYETRVHAANRNAEYGIPVTVYADSTDDAKQRAITLGWSGHRQHARVEVLSVEQVPPSREETPHGAR